MKPKLRPLCDLTTISYDVHETSVLVIGGGVAGFSAAIAAAPHADVLCITKETALVSNTWAAQGGVAAVLSDEDSVESHRDDTIDVGCGICHLEAVEVVVKEGPECIRRLIEWGGSFDEQDGQLHLTLEGGHSQKRVIHARGDQTGMEVQATLLRKVKSFDSVELWEHGFAIDLIVDEGRCLGALLYRNGKYVLVHAKATILATGGAGQLYRETTNPPIATGDGFAMALRAQAPLRDMEFIQFHPTTLYIAGSARHLITEAVRGEGGILRDMHGERFMVNYHPRAELAPRDIVSRSIVRHMAAGGDTHVFLDLTHLSPDFVRKRFPLLNQTCQLYNFDVAKDLIPIHPSVHYMMGGVVVDLDARTEMDGLFACGEVASSGLHGANRLASNSLLEGLVFGWRAGQAAAQEKKKNPLPTSFEETDFGLEGSVINVPDMLNSIKSLMWRDVGIVRNADQLQEAIERLQNWANYVLQCRFQDPSGWELVNTLTLALAVVESAAKRTESRGAHFRTDFPETDDSAWRRHSLIPMPQDASRD
ncbi:MAG: L-aspartate oxidase [Planctomycetota bacterium]|jgi:L-aspartate oxidase